MKLVLSELRYFIELADRLSFTVAAESLGITQPTLSTSIKQLEGKLGQKLFDRGTRGVRLSPFGHEALRLAKRLVETAESTEEELQDFAQGRLGRLRLAGPSIFFATTLQKAMVQFRRENHGIVLEIEDTDGDTAADLLRRDLADFAVIPSPTEGQSFVTQKVGEMRAVAVYHRGHHAEIPAEVSLRDLRDSEVVILKSRDGAGRAFNAQLRDFGATFGHVYRLNEFPAVKGLIEAGFGVGLMSDLTAGQLPPDFVQVPVVQPAQVVDIHICRASHRIQTPTMGRFARILRSVM